MPGAPRQVPVGELRFRALAAAVPQMIWVSGPKGGVQYVSPKWLAFTGSDEAGLLGNGFLTFVHPDDRETLAGRRTDPNRGSDPALQSVEMRLRRHDGVYRLMEVHVEYLRDEAGEITWVVGGALDVTDERAASAIAREQREQLRVALSVTGLARYAYYPSEQRLVGDDRLTDIVGLDAEQLMDEEGLQGFFARIHSEDAPAVERGIQAALDGGPDCDVVYRMERPAADGTTEQRWIAARGRAELFEGVPPRLIGVIEDVTDRRREEEARLQFQKREAIGTLASGIAHDFNNVISAILSNADVADAEIEMGESPKTSVSEIKRGALRAAALVRQLLSVSSEEAPTEERFDLGQVMGDACALLTPTMPPSVALDLHVLAAPAPVQGDPSQLHQVAINLVSNAVAAIGAGPGSITITVDALNVDHDGPGPCGLPSGPYALLEVRDTGDGIPAGVLRRVFDPFFTTKGAGVGAGTGLGLTASQRIAQNHGGDIAIRTQVGLGTAVRVYLPAAPVASAAPTAPASQADSAGGAAVPRVMFVDDEEALVRLAQRALPLHGFDATAYLDPREALDAFTAEPGHVDVIVTDLSMPGLTGLDLIRAIRKIRPDVPVVLSSGYLTRANRESAKRLGVEVIVAKPCSIDDLTSAIRKVYVAP